MDIKWQKNAHVLIKSDAGYLTADDQENIRRASFFGRLCFLIKDWCTGGKESVRLNKAIEKTLEAVKEELARVQNDLSLTLNDLPSSRDILDYNDLYCRLSPETKRTIGKVYGIIQRLILKGKRGFFCLGIPNYDYRTECLKDLPQAIFLHSQANQQVKTHPALQDIERFFSLSFIQDEIKSNLVDEEIDRKSNIWVG